MNIFKTITTVKTLKERLIYARELRGLTQGQLARDSKCSQSAIGNVESGIRETLKNVVMVARALGISADWLYDGKGPEPNKFSAVPTRHQHSVSDYNTNEKWPFKTVSPDIFDLLLDTEKDHIEKDILMRVQNRGDPQKNKTPANYSYGTGPI